MKANSARQQGDTYQARAFWLKACRLFERHTKVERIGYDISDVRHFDDLAILYSEPIYDAHGEMISADYYQIKWHVDQSGSLTCDALTDPSFIGSKSTSILQRLYEAAKHESSAKITARYNLVTTWGIRNDDELAKLVSGRDGELRLDVLFGNSRSSRYSRLLREWSTHLDLDHENLRNVLARFRLCANSYNLDRLTRTLSDNLARVGLSPVDYGSRVNPYDSLIERLSSEGRDTFTAQEIQCVCQQEGLWTGAGSSSSYVGPSVGLRSFLRFAEHMEEKVDYLLDFANMFDNRQIIAPDYWNSKVGPMIREFMIDSVAPLDRCRLYLSTHSSIAFASGYELNPKAGTTVALVQNAATGTSIWEAGSTGATEQARLWDVKAIDIDSQGRDVGVVLSVSHDARTEALNHIRDHVPQVGQVLEFTIRPATGHGAVKDGNHAWSLAQEVVKMIGEHRPRRVSSGLLHVFSAAPNGLVFFLGRLSHSLGPIQLYEHAFESDWPTRYRKSLLLPIDWQPRPI